MELMSQLEAQKMVTMSLQGTIKSNQDTLGDMDFLRKQVIDKDARVQELLLEKAQLEEQNTKDIEEITDTSYQEITELEKKLQQAGEEKQEIETKHADQMQGFKTQYEAQIDELKE